MIWNTIDRMGCIVRLLLGCVCCAVVYGVIGLCGTFRMLYEALEGL